MAFPRLCLLLLLLTCCSVIASPAAEDSDAPLFLVADVWPWGYLRENNQPAGLIDTFALRLAERAGIKMRNRVLPHQRVLADFRRNDGDFTLLFENPRVDGFAERVGKVQVSNILLVTQRDSKQELTLSALAGKTLGYIGGTYYGEAFEDDQDIVKLPITSLDQAINMLELGRLDALITSDILLHHSLKKMQLSPQAFRARVLTREHPAHLYASGSARAAVHLSAIRAALAEMRDSGELDGLFRNALQLPPISND